MGREEPPGPRVAGVEATLKGSGVASPEWGDGFSLPHLPTPAGQVGESPLLALCAETLVEGVCTGRAGLSVAVTVIL